jgi:hypothetical protein
MGVSARDTPPAPPVTIAVFVAALAINVSFEIKDAGDFGAAYVRG